MVRGTLKPKQTEVLGCLKGTEQNGGKTDWGDEGWRFSNRRPSKKESVFEKTGDLLFVQIYCLTWPFQRVPNGS